MIYGGNPAAILRPCPKNGPGASDKSIAINFAVQPNYSISLRRSGAIIKHVTLRTRNINPVEYIGVTFVIKGRPRA